MRQPTGHRGQAATRYDGKEAVDRRDPFLDNAKYLTIVLVAVGHTWAPLSGDSRAVSALYYLLYTFHMPMFVLISGYLSRSFEGTPRQLKRLVTGLLVPYLIFQTLYTLLLRWVGDDPDRGFQYHQPAFALWFLVALFLWRLTAPVWKRLRLSLPVSLVIAVAAAVTPALGDELSLMKVAQFLPFFVLGLQLRPEHFRSLRRRTVRVLALPVAAGALAVSYASVPYISGAPFLHDRSAQDLGLPAWLGVVMTLASFGCALVMTTCFLAWVPRGHTGFTSLGTGTLYAYLLHVYPLRLAREWGLFETGWAGRPLNQALLTALAAGTMTLLCTAPVRRAFRWAVEPRPEWFFRQAPDSGTPPPAARRNRSGHR